MKVCVNALTETAGVTIYFDITHAEAVLRGPGGMAVPVRGLCPNKFFCESKWTPVMKI